MGIKHLNQFLRKECSEAIRVMALNELSGRTVVVDASIFMYRFTADNALLENMYSMLSFFKMHDIVALFIFDGKPPEEKRKTLHKRSRLKRIAELQYNRLLDDTANSNNNNNSNSNSNINAAALKALRRRFIRVSDADFDRVKTLMRAFGVQYIVAGGEADALCAQMVIKRKAYACVSDDTDLFVYGCCRVLRHINLFDQTVTMYDMHKMLHILGITMTEFRQICVISGTDYLRGLKLKTAIGLFKHYKKCGQDAEEHGDVFAPDFYTWMHHTQGDRFDYDNTMTVYNMFETMPTQLASTFVPANTKRNDVLLHEVMAHENFIFVA